MGVEIMLRAIIVDDEELAIKRLKRILSESGEVKICSTFLNPLEAYEFAAANPIDVVFLDISMPEINGITLSRALLDLDPSIDIVFVTGYDNYAVQAFELSALDYIMKPITEERIAKTLNKLSHKHPSLEVVQSHIVVQMFNGLKIQRQDYDHLPLKLRSPKTEELLAFLICKKSVSREEIIDVMWGDLSREKAWKNLNSTLYYIRKAISAGNMGDFIKADRNGIRIEESFIYCDLYEFERLLKQTRQVSEQSAELFKQMELLYIGELLRGKSYGWATEWSRRLEQDYIEVLETAARFYLVSNELSQSLYYFNGILKLDAIREDIHREVIKIYIQLGRKTEAHRQYRELEKLLLQELGIEPESRIKDILEEP